MFSLFYIYVYFSSWIFKFMNEWWNCNSPGKSTLSHGTTYCIWSNIVYKTAPKLVFNLTLCSTLSYFSQPAAAAAGCQALSESRKWGVNTWDQLAEDSPSPCANHSHHPRQPAQFHIQGSPELCLWCEGERKKGLESSAVGGWTEARPHINQASLDMQSS